MFFPQLSKCSFTPSPPWRTSDPPAEGLAIPRDHTSSWLCSAQAYEVHRSSTAAAAKSLQSCPTLCDPIDGSSPGSPVPGILQARTLEWVAISSSSAGKWKEKVKSRNPMNCSLLGSSIHGISRQEYWSGVPLPCEPNPYFIKGQFSSVSQCYYIYPLPVLRMT